MLCSGSFCLVVLTPSVLKKHSEWCVFFLEKKVHSLSVAPESLAIWNKELESLESELLKGLKTSPVAAPEHIPGFFYSKRTRIQDLDIVFGSLLLSDVVVWWWLRVNVVCS